jgi:uncharacterized SAM-binding protein YcdF (DUF218 family)
LILATIIYLLSTRVVGNFLLIPFEEPFNHKHIPHKVDAMVILSGGTYGKNANLTLGYSSLKRLLYGTMIAKKEQLPIIYSGRGLRKYNESISAKDTVNELNRYFDINLTENPIFKKNKFSIFYETESIDTYENAKYTKKLFSKIGIDSPTIYLVTSAFHMKRSMMLYEYFGFNVIPIATDFVTSTVTNRADLFPSMLGLLESYFAIHEYIGILALSLKLK